MKKYMLAAAVLGVIVFALTAENKTLEKDGLKIDYILVNNDTHKPGVAITKITFANGESYSIDEAVKADWDAYFTNNSAGVHIIDHQQKDAVSPLFENSYYKMVFYMAERAVIVQRGLSAQ